MNWEKLPAIEGKSGGCANCGPLPNTFPPDGVIAIGFGSAMLTCDDRIVYQEERDGDACMTGAEAEALAAIDPDHDWRISLYGPLSGRVYQRHEAGVWALVEQDGGFP